jgi:hypothetical protein
MSAQRPVPYTQGRRIVICDYSTPVQSVTDLLRMSDYCVFEAHDGLAAEELCRRMPEIALLVLNTFGKRIDVGDLVGRVRLVNPGIQILHIGAAISADLPYDVPTIPEVFTAEFLLSYVTALIERRLIPRLPGADLRLATSPTVAVVDWGQAVPRTAATMLPSDE